MGVKFEQLEIAAVGEVSGEFLAAFIFWEPNCDPGRFEVMLVAKLLIFSW
jgi:hypothetical protein